MPKKYAIRYGIDFGTNSLKFAFAGAPNRNNALYGILTLPFLNGYASLGYYDEETGGWTFGNEIFERRIDTFEHIVEIKSLINLLNSDRTVKAYSNSHTFTKYGGEIGREARADYSPTFECPLDTPKTVVEKFFKQASADFFTPALKRLKGVLGKDNCDYISECEATYPYNADDRYKIELKRIIEECMNLQVIKMMPEPVAAGLYAFVCNSSLLQGKKALLVDIGASRTSTALVELSEGRIETEKFYPSLEVGGADYDNAVAEYAKRASERHEDMSAMQKYHLRMRTRAAKEYLSRSGNDTVVEYDSEVTLRIPLEEDNFPHIVFNVTRKIRDTIQACIKDSGACYVILTGGGSHTCGLYQDLKKELDSNVRIVRLTQPDDPFDQEDESAEPQIYDPVGCESAAAAVIGASLGATGKFTTITVAPLSYGTDIVRAGVKYMSTIIKKNTRIPCEKEMRYNPSGNTDHVSVDILSSTVADDLIPMDKTTTLIDQDLMFSRKVDSTAVITVHIKIDEDGIGRAVAGSPLAPHDVTSEFKA